MKSNILSVASLLALAFAGWQAFATWSRAPAFNRSLQIGAASGGKIPRYTDSMYDRAEYYYWVALGWHGQTFAATPPSGQGATPQHEAVQEAYVRVRDAATESLRHNPGDPGAWMLVASAESALGDTQSALMAYRRWQEAAPHSSSRATARMIFLIFFMEDPERRALALKNIDRQIIQEDLLTLYSDKASRDYAVQLSRNPVIAAFGADLQTHD